MSPCCNLITKGRGRTQKINPLCICLPQIISVLKRAWDILGLFFPVCKLQTIRTWHQYIICMKTNYPPNPVTYLFSDISNAVISHTVAMKSRKLLGCDSGTVSCEASVQYQPGVQSSEFHWGMTISSHVLTHISEVTHHLQVYQKWELYVQPTLKGRKIGFPLLKRAHSQNLGHIFKPHQRRAARESDANGNGQKPRHDLGVKSI